MLAPSRKQRLDHVVAHRRRVIFGEVGRQQVGMVGEHLPQHRQQRLVGQHAFPAGFQPAYPGVRQLGGEGLAQHELPRVEFEQVADSIVLQIGKLPAVSKTDLINVQELAPERRLPARNPADIARYRDLPRYPGSR